MNYLILALGPIILMSLTISVIALTAKVYFKIKKKREEKWLAKMKKDLRL